MKKITAALVVLVITLALVTPIHACADGQPAGAEGTLIETHQATCTQAGYDVYNRGGGTLAIVPGNPATGHSYQTEATQTVVNPDGSWAKVTWQKCTLCGAVAKKTTPLDVQNVPTQKPQAKAGWKGGFAEKLEMVKGQKCIVNVAVYGNGKMTYVSSNTSVATVTRKGVIKARRAGRAIITVVAGGTGLPPARVLVTVKKGGR